MALIDIGVAAINRAAALTTNYTCANLGNPANDTGTLTSVEIWLYTATASNGTIATLSGSGTTWTSRDRSDIGAISAGSKQTFSGLAIDVEADDIIGYFGSGRMEVATSGGSGVIRTTLDRFDGNPQTYSSGAAWVISLYGTGETASVTSIKLVMGVPIANVKTINGVPIADVKSFLGVSNVD